MEISVIGFFWYRNEAEFERLRAMSEDGAQLHETFAGFIESVEKRFEEFKRTSPGVDVVKVEADPEEYLAWCRAKGMKINSASRRGFASDKAFEIFVHQRSKDSTRGEE